MKALAAYIMKGRVQAIAIATGFAVLSLIFPLLGLLSGAAVGLVTLRVGPTDGITQAVATCLIAGLVAWLTGMPLLIPTISSLVVLILLVWLASSVLRYTRSLAQSITTITAAGLLFICFFHLWVGDPAAWWQSHFDEFFAQATESMMMDQQVVFRQNLETWSSIMTGFVTMAFLLNVIFSVFIARAWQAMLYNPGGFQQEFHALQFGKKVAIFALVVATLALIPDNVIGYINKDLLMLVMMIYVLQGIAVVHALVALKGLHWAWLIGLYLLVVLMAQIVAIAGYIDTWLNFRKRASGASS